MVEFRSYEERIGEGIQYKDREFAHAMIRKWPDGRVCISRLREKRPRRWIFVRLATEADINSIKEMIAGKKKAEELFGEEKQNDLVT